MQDKLPLVTSVCTAVLPKCIQGYNFDCCIMYVVLSVVSHDPLRGIYQEWVATYFKFGTLKAS